MGNFFRNGLPMNVHFATSAQESFLKIDVIGFQEGLNVIHTQDVNASTTGPYGQHDAQEKHYPSDLTDEEWEYIAPPAAPREPARLEVGDRFSRDHKRAALSCPFRG